MNRQMLEATGIISITKQVAGTQFACFTSIKVQILTLKALQRGWAATARTRSMLVYLLG
jgi:hypothetical protein